MADDSRKLTTKQARAIAVLLSCRTTAEAAERAKVGKRTLDRWLTDPVFKSALASAEGDLIDAAARRLLYAQEAAIETLAAIMTTSSNAAGVRVRAAQIIIESALKLRELRSFEQRLQALETNIRGT
jgi:phage terminase small subunit